MSDEKTPPRKGTLSQHWKRVVEPPRLIPLRERGERSGRENAEVRRLRWCIPEDTALAMTSPFWMNRILPPMGSGHFEEFTFGNADPARVASGIMYRLHDSNGQEIQLEGDAGTAPHLQGTWDRPPEVYGGPVKIEVVVADPSWAFEWSIPIDPLFDPATGQGWWIQEANVGFAYKDKRVPFAYFRLVNEVGDAAILVAENLPLLPD